MLDSVLQYSQFASGVILLLFSILQFTYKRKTFLNFNLAGLYFCLSFVILYLWLLHTGFIVSFRYLIHLDVAVTFAIGPCAYFYLRSITVVEVVSLKRYLLNLLPSMTCFVTIILMNYNDDSIYRYYLLTRTHNPVSVVSPAIIILDYISNISILCYMSLAIRNFYTLLRDNKDHKSIREIKIILVYAVMIVVIMVAVLIASILGKPVVIILGVNLLTALGVWYFLFSFRYPDFTQKALREAKLIRYENIPLAADDAEAILGRLRSLMDDDRLYTDETLTLQKMSSFLGITPHHLSRIINQHMNMSFPTFLNSYRIAEAKKLLIESKDLTVLEIAFMTGFNSKSTFNTLFSKATGATPREFRLKGTLKQ
jgi:AraC-like DNA-binding protein